MATKRKWHKEATDSARKRRKRERDQQLSLTRINIKSQFVRWTQFKADESLTTHEDVAKLLLDCYEKYIQMKTSTPAGGLLSIPPIGISSVGETETASSTLSGVEAMHSSYIVAPETTVPYSEAGKRSTTSDEDPFGLVAATIQDQSYKYSVDNSDIDSIFTEDDEVVSSWDDEDGTHNITLEEEIMPPDSEADEDSSVEESSEEYVEGVIRLTNAEDLTADSSCIAYLSSLKLLYNHCPRTGMSCGECGNEWTIETARKGTAIYLTWICTNRHILFKWCSQPLLKAKGVHAGDFMVAANTLLSGNNFSKVSLLLRFSNIGTIQQSFFDRVQALYCCPAIQELWDRELDKVHNELGDKEVILAGDARNDSPGHCAKFCTYTLMEESSKKIVNMVIVDKRQTDLKSVNMERLGMKKGIDELIDKGMNVTEIVTDAHTAIAAMMRKDYQNIFHSWDVWHGAKNFGKKLSAAAVEKSCGELKPWVHDIINHFWFSSQTANGSVDAFKATWRGVLHHTTNSHEWALGDGAGPGKCQHDPIPERDKPWLTKDSPSHTRLRKLVLDKRLMNTFEHYVNFRHTGNLESFHNHILMYAAKRFAFRYETYMARNQLAALDYQQHLDLPRRTTKDGKEMSHRAWNRRSQRWVCVPVKVKKEYSYIPSLQQSIVQACMTDREPMARKRVLKPDHPKLIRPTIAPVTPTSTAELVKAQKSRFKNIDDSANFLTHV